MTTPLVLPSGVTLERRETPALGTPLPPHVLERIAVRWAAGTGCTPAEVIMHEEELGWAVWAPGHPASYSTFVDKVTGRITGFANPAFPDDQYRAQLTHENGALPRPGFPGPEIQAPGVNAEVSLPYARSVAPSVRTVDPPPLHPLVRHRLLAIPARSRVRGGAWHPELIALGYAVQSADAERRRRGQEPLTPADLDDLEVRARLWRVREPADARQGDSSGSPCPTCAQVLGHRPPRSADTPSPWRRHQDRRRLHRRPPSDPHQVVEEVTAVAGVTHQHVAFPAAVEALNAYLGAQSRLDAPGKNLRTTPFHIDPTRAADTADTLARVALRIGAPLFPLGTAGPEGILAIDPAGRVVLIDETGEWLLGTGLAVALDVLLLGRTAPRI